MRLYRLLVLTAMGAALLGSGATAHADRPEPSHRHSGNGPAELTVIEQVSPVVVSGTVKGGPVEKHRAGLWTASEQNGDTLKLYCIDIKQDTGQGISYNRGEWTKANVTNLGYVAQILNDYFPVTAQPATLATDSEKAAAVQAAIWFFTDAYTLSATDALAPATQEIIDAVTAKGPVEEQTRDALAIQGPAEGKPGTVLGPFTLSTQAPEAKLTIVDGQLFSDAAGATPLPSGSLLKNGDTFYVRRDDTGTTRVQATAALTTPSGNVFVYAPDNAESPQPPTAQKLILAEESTISVTAAKKILVRVPKAAPVQPKAVVNVESAAPRPTPKATAATKKATQVPVPSPAQTQTVRATGSGLPSTGASVLFPFATALALVLTGAALILTTRRRRTG